MSVYRLKNKIAVLRLNRLGHIPSAKYAAQILHENSLPVVVVEIGNSQKATQTDYAPYERVRFGYGWFSKLPRRIRPTALFALSLGKLFWHCLVFGRAKLFIAHGFQEQTIAWVLWLLFRIPYVVHVHEVFDGPELTPFNRLLFYCEGAILRRARFLIFSENDRARVYQQRYELQNPIYFAANCPRKRIAQRSSSWRADLGIAERDTVMIYVGGIGQSNPLELAVHALSEFPQLHFVLIGWSDPKAAGRLEELANELSVSQRFHYLGEVPDKWPYLDGADLSFCVYDPNCLRLRYLASASNKLMESLAAGVPVITSSNPDFRRFLENYKVGIALSETSEKALTEAIRKFLTHPKLRQEFSTNALYWHRERFYYEGQFSEILSELRNWVKMPASVSAISSPVAVHQK